MIELIYPISFILMSLVIWFKTEAFIEYSELFKLDKIFKIEDYKTYKKTNPTMDYNTFLRLKYPNFITKLISCPYCLGFWITIFFVYFYGIINLSICYLISIILYKLLDKYIL